MSTEKLIEDLEDKEPSTDKKEHKKKDTRAIVPDEKHKPSRKKKSAANGKKKGAKSKPDNQEKKEDILKYSLGNLEKALKDKDWSKVNRYAKMILSKDANNSKAVKALQKAKKAQSGS